MADSRVIEALAVTAEVMGRKFSPEAARLLADDLSQYPADQILVSLKKCRLELKTFPTVADIISRMPNERPGPEEAWAMIPLDEESSVVWTEEMRDAFSTARGLLDEDPIAARMAFREVYSRLLTEARLSMKPVKWEPSLGHNKELREPVLREAFRKGRISLEQMNQLLPDTTPTPRLQVTGPVEELSQVDPKEMLAKIREQISRAGEV